MVERPIEAAALVADEWEYLAEGGQNLLVRHAPAHGTAQGRTPFALRIRKCPRSQGSSASGAQDCPAGAAAEGPPRRKSDGAAVLDSHTFQSEILAVLLQLPKLGSQDPDGASPAIPDVPEGTELIPQAYALELAPGSDFLQRLSERVEPARPANRRGIDAIDTSQRSVWAIEDLTASAGGHESARGKAHVLSVEIKPKWLFKHDHCRFSSSFDLDPAHARWKRTLSRYRMHRVLRCASETTAPSRAEWDTWYDPVDLVSDDSAFVQRAVAALYDEWAGGSASSVPSTAAGGHGDEPGHRKHMNNNLRIYADATTVQHGDWHQLRAFFSSEGAQGGAESPEAIRERFIALLTRHLHRSPALRRLAAVEKRLDSIDIAELGAAWEQLLGTAAFDAAGEHSGLLAEPTPDEFRAAVERVRDGADPSKLLDALAAREAGRSQSLSQLRDGIVDKVLNATLKDCSLFLRFVRGAGAASDQVQCTMRLVDLDPKSTSRMRKWWQLDRDIIEHFDRWTQAELPL